MRLPLVVSNIAESESVFALGIGAILFAFVVIIVLLLVSHIRNREIVIQRDQIHQLQLQTIELEKLKTIATAEEEQLRRIGRYLHDEIGGNLHVLLKLLESSSFDVQDNKSIQKATEIASVCIDSVRLTSQELVPYFLLNFGLKRTLQTMMDNINEIKGLSLSYSESLEWSPDLVPQEKAIHIYRLIQEVYSNLLRHAKPTEINLRVETMSDHMSILFSHNGVGISQHEFNQLSSTGKSLGLKNILLRAELLNAQLLYQRLNTNSIIHLQILVDEHHNY